MVAKKTKNEDVYVIVGGGHTYGIGRTEKEAIESAKEIGAEYHDNQWRFSISKMTIPINDKRYAAMKADLYRYRKLNHN